jgi:hypothetical protein
MPHPVLDRCLLLLHLLHFEIEPPEHRQIRADQRQLLIPIVRQLFFPLPHQRLPKIRRLLNVTIRQIVTFGLILWRPHSGQYQS